MTKEEARKELEQTSYKPSSPEIFQRFLDFIKILEQKFKESMEKPMTNQTKKLLVYFVRKGYIVRGYENAALKGKL
jgi:hypothetical protein